MPVDYLPPDEAPADAGAPSDRSNPNRVLILWGLHLIRGRVWCAYYTQSMGTVKVGRN